MDFHKDYGMKAKNLILGFLLLASFGAFAGVNLKNGNFYISYTDIIVPGSGETLEITRTYNSKSTRADGWFGLGWASVYETKILVGPDGSVSVLEHGSGSITRFTPKTAVDAGTAAQKIIDAMREKATVSDKVAQDLVKKLSQDQELRQMYATKYGVVSTIAAGTVLYSSKRGMQELHKTKDGYKRVSGDGKTEEFNEQGKLSKIAFKNGYEIAFNYKNGLLETIKDSKAKQLFFEWYSEGKVRSISSGSEKKAEYKYKGSDLAESKDVGGNVYTYGYDTNHNLLEIGYSDKTAMKIGYEPKTQFVSSITNRNNEVTTYEYGSDPKNADLHYWTTVSKKNLLGKMTKSRYEYEIRTRADGSQYTYKILTDLNGDKTETVYSECCGLPLKIARGKQVTNFEYNDKGLLVKKNSTEGENVALEYNDKYNKISKVVDRAGWTSFKYDKKGNLEEAENSKGKQVLLIYDGKGRITKMVDVDKGSKDKRTLSFEYDANGKPVEIAIDKLGKINIAYDDFGEIKKVDSKSGHKMAVEVTQAFQNLLAIVRPAGVSLSL